MTVHEGGLDIPVRTLPDKKSAIRCKQISSVWVEAVFPAVVVLTTGTHVHLSNYLAAWEFDPDPEIVDKVQSGLAYVFRARWPLERYETLEGDRAYSMEQIFDADCERYHFHELAKVSYDGLRHRWNGHDGSLRILSQTHVDAAGEMMWPLGNQRELLVKKSGSRAGFYRLPRGAYTWRRAAGDF